MSIKIAHKQSAAEVISSVTAEMLIPRVAQSAKETGIKKEYAVPEGPAKRRLFHQGASEGDQPNFLPARLLSWSCKTTPNRDECTVNLPLYSINPSLRKKQIEVGEETGR
jgi:hypothetical protein